MSRLRIGKRRGGRPGAAGGGGGSPTYGKLGVNLDDSNYYSGNDYFCNLVRATSWAGESVAAGTSTATWIKLALWPTYGYMKPGNYKATAPAGVLLTLNDSGSGIINRVDGTNSITFTVAKTGDDVYSTPNYELRLTVNNTTGAAVPLNLVGVFHVEDEVRYATGKIFRTGLLARLATKSVIRMLDCTQANFDDTETTARRFLSPGDLPLESTVSWAANRMPMSVMGKLINEIKELYPSANPTLHVTTHCGSNGRRYNAVAGTDTFNVVDFAGATIPHLFNDGERVAFYGYTGTQVAPLAQWAAYYVVNATSTTFQISNTSGGAVINITEDHAPDWGRQCDSIDRDLLALWTEQFAQLHAVAPNINIIVEAVNELWNTGFGQGHWVFGQGNRIDPNNTRAAGVAFLSLTAWKAAELAGYPRAQITRAIGMQAVYFDAIGSSLDVVDPGIITAGQTVAQLATAGGDGVVVVGPYSWAAATNGADDMGSGALAAASAQTATDEQWLTWMTNGNTALAAYTATMKVRVAQKNAAIKVTSYECGQHIAGTVGGGVGAAIGNRFKAWLQSASGLAWFQDYRQRLFVNNQIENLVYYTQSGRWSLSYSDQFASWGYKRATEAPDTPLSIEMDGAFTTPYWTGAVHTTDGSAADTQAKIDAASNGDIVRLPASGSFTWTATVTVPASKYIMLDLNNSIVQFNSATGALVINDHATGHNRLTNGTLRRGTSGPAFDGQVFLADANGGGIITDHLVFDQVAGSQSPLLDVRARGKGVMHSCRFEGLFAAQEAIHAVGWGAVDTTGWTTPVVQGSESLFYFEDCVFNRAAGQANDAFFQGYYGCRVVIRRNLMNGFQLDMHGSAGAIGARWWEILNNTWQGFGVGWSCSFRGGSGIITGSVNNTAGFADIQLYEEDSGYPADYQVGRGTNQTSDPAYIWNNAGGSGTAITIGYNVGGVAGMIQQNRDVYETAKSGYTQYTYPHPYRSLT